MLRNYKVYVSYQRSGIDFSNFYQYLVEAESEEEAITIAIKVTIDQRGDGSVLETDCWEA